MLTGKPLVIGGSHGRLEATGRGVVITIREAANVVGVQLNGASAALQGFGNVGSMTAKFLHQLGVKVVAVSDVNGAIYKKDGLPVPDLIEFTSRGKSIAEYRKAEPIRHEDLFRLPVDIFVPAAIENQITSETATHMQVKIVAEAANGPTTPEGNRILENKGVFIIPDILCNAGGVTVSYFEWVQNEMNYYWKEGGSQSEAGGKDG